MDDGESSNKENAIRDLRAAHAETIQELEKTRKLLSMESRISKDYKVVKLSPSDQNKFDIYLR